MSAAQSVTATFGLAPYPPDGTQQNALALGTLNCGTSTSFNGSTSGGSHGWLVVTLQGIGPACTPAQIRLDSLDPDIAMTVYDSSGNVVPLTAPTLLETTISGTYYIEVFSSTGAEDSWTLNILV
jgi:hypothetical protein